MHASRRSILAGLGLSLVGMASAAHGRKASLAGPLFEDPRSIEVSEWARRIGDGFAVSGRAGAALRLVAVEPARSAGRRPGRLGRQQNFVAVFESMGAGAPEGDTTYILSHPSLGRLPLYLGPKSDAAGRARLIAAFN